MSCCSFRCLGALLVAAIQAALLLVVIGLALFDCHRPPPGNRHLNESVVSASRATPVTLSQADLDFYDLKGYIVVRGALPREVVWQLYSRVLKRFRLASTKASQYTNTFLIRMNGMWLTDDAFADFLLHRDSPIGALVAQLLNASEVRFTNEGLNGISDKDRGSTWHFDINGPYNRSPSPRKLPTIRLWIPLGPSDVVADEDGGSLEIVPLDEMYDAEDRYGACFDTDDASTVFLTDRCNLEDRIVTPSVAMGDLVLYSPQLLHQSQPMSQGIRIAYTGSLYDPSRMPEWVRETGTAWLGEDEKPAFRDDFLGFTASPQCEDGKAIHFNPYWQSANTHFVSEETSGCQPLIYPRPLPHEVQAIRECTVTSRDTNGPTKHWIKRHAERLSVGKLFVYALLDSERTLHQAGLFR